eukprot:SAG11_NODE_27353_length_333_cov_2.333333_1_plen_67_part_01
MWISSSGRCSHRGVDVDAVVVKMKYSVTLLNLVSRMGTGTRVPGTGFRGLQHDQFTKLDCKFATSNS